MDAWQDRDGDYPCPCARCGNRFTYREATAIYPHDGMLCSPCGEDVEAGNLFPRE